MENQYRQGDVTLSGVAEIPESAQIVARRDGLLILAEGEVTGHAHVIDATPEQATLVAVRDERFLRLASAARLVHEEHAPINVAPGTYRVTVFHPWNDRAELTRDLYPVGD
jgi:hypothetical protein